MILPLLTTTGLGPHIWGFLAMPFVAMALLAVYRSRLAKAAGVERSELFSPPVWMFFLALVWVFFSLADPLYHLFGLPVLVVWLPGTAWRLVLESRRVGAPQTGVDFAFWLVASTLFGEGAYWLASR